MAEYQIHPLLQRAIFLAQSGRIDDAHALLHKITSEDPTQELAWLWLVQTEPDHQQRIQILEECLRHNPQSEYARKGLAGFRTGPLSGVRPPGKPPTYFRPKYGTGPLKPRPVFPRKRLLAVLGAVVGLALIITAVVAYPQWHKYVGLPADPIAALLATAAPTRTGTRPAATFVSLTPTSTKTPTITRTPTVTLTPTLTRTPTLTPLATLFQGAPVPGEPFLLFLDPEACAVLRLPISGGTPETLTTEVPVDCDHPRISPDGSKLTFLSKPPDVWISMANLDGSRRKIFTRLTANTGEGRTIWTFEYSPDGQSIGYVASGFAKDAQGTIHVDDSYGFLYIAPIASGFARQQKALGVDVTLADMISWSPDGRWLFSFDRGNPLEAISYPFAFRGADSRAVWISHDDPYLGNYDWSPDSKYLASLYPKKPATAALPDTSPADQNYIIVSGLDETKRYIALEEKGYDPKFGARWFPNQKSFLLYQMSSRSLVAVSNAGAVLQTLAVLETAPAYAAWSPDGQWLTVIQKSAGGNSGTLMILRPDGSDLRILARNIRIAPVVWR